MKKNNLPSDVKNEIENFIKLYKVNNWNGFRYEGRNYLLVRIYDAPSDVLYSEHNVVSYQFKSKDCMVMVVFYSENINEVLSIDYFDDAPF